jgi:hypothetical protein
MVELLKMKANRRRKLPHSYISPYTLIFVIDIFIFDIFTFRHFYLSTKVGLTVFLSFFVKHMCPRVIEKLKKKMEEEKQYSH